MRKILPLLALSAAIPVMAQELPAPRFAFIDPEAILANSTKGKKAFQELEALGKSLNEKVQAVVEEQKQLQMQAKTPGLTDEGRLKLQQAIQDNETRLKRTQEDCQKEFEHAQSEKLGKVYAQEVAPIVQEVAKEWKLQVIFNIKESARLLHYADQAWLNQLNQEVLKRYEAKTGGNASAPAPKPAKAPARKK